MKLIIKSSLFFLIFFIAYQLLLIEFNQVQNQENFQSWWQENEAKAQQFVYTKKVVQTVLVGSSMSANLKLKNSDPFIYNLSFIGGSSLTGLEIIKQSNKLPQVLIIETNWIDRNIDQNLIDKLFSPIGAPLKRNFPGLLEANQPVNLIGNGMQNLIAIAPIDTELHLDAKKFDEAIKKNVKSDNLVDRLTLTTYLNQANDYAQYFRRKGVQVYYLQVPVNSKIENTKKYSLIKNYIDKSSIQKIKSPLNINLKTTDGYHFDKPSAAIFAKYLSQYAN
jgi:hypothetical protein